MADKHTIARPYARAAFEVARETDSLKALSDSFAAADEILADGQVDAFLGDPALDDAKRLEFLQGLFAKVAGKDSVFAGSSEHGNNFLKLLLENRRVDALPEIAEQFDVLKDAAENVVEVTVTSATELSKSEQDEFVKALKERFGRDIDLTTETDETLIGGAVIRAGDVVIDGSLRSRLEGLANALVA